MPKFGDHGTPRQMLASMFVGTAVSFVLHGITCCQAVWYLRTQSDRSSNSMKAFIWFVWQGETLNCSFMVFAAMNTFLSPARTNQPSCRHWSGPAQQISSAICTISVEFFFILRMWRLSEKKKLAALTFIPYIIGHSFAIAQIIRSLQVRCQLAVPNLDELFIFGTYSFRLLGDGIVFATMCYMLHVRSSGFTRHNHTMRIIRGLIKWSISTGMLTWISTVLFLISYAGIIPSGYGIFYVRGGLYTNAMLAQLNARMRYQEMAQASIPLTSLHLGPTSSVQPSRIDSQLVSRSA